MKTKMYWLVAAMILFLSANLSAQNDEISQNGTIKNKKAFIAHYCKNIQKQSDSISIIAVGIEYTDFGRKNLDLPKSKIGGKLVVIQVNADANKYKILAYKYISVSGIEEDLKWSDYPWRNVKPNTIGEKLIELCNAEAIAKTVD